MEDEPVFILGRALAAWVNPPKWYPLNRECSREEAQKQFTEFVADVCRNWDLVIAKMPSMEEVK